jgi:transcriptional regulator with PAS, ATPase and Fis domain
MDHFLKELSEKKSIKVPPITEKDLALFLNYDYPGNVRELQHIIERFCILGGGTEELFASQPKTSMENDGLDMDSFLADSDPLQTLRARVEKRLIQRALDLNGNNHTQAALQLKISRPALYKKIKKLGL